MNMLDIFIMINLINQNDIFNQLCKEDLIDRGSFFIN